MTPPRIQSKAIIAAQARRLANDVSLCIGFYTRLPVPSGGAAGPGSALGRALRAAPFAGALVGGCGGAAMVAAAACGLSPVLQSLLALTTTIAVSGALHEDGLADVADGFGGGRTSQDKLDIMRDSRIGTYGVLALVLSLALRASALATLAERFGSTGAVLALVAAEAASRGFGLIPMAVLDPARTDGLGRTAGRIGARVLLAAALFSVAFGLAAPVAAGIPVLRAGLACLLSLLAAVATALLAGRQIGGFTGDVAGAAQQAAGVAFLLGLLMGPGFT